MAQAFEGADAQAYALIFEGLHPSWQKHVDIIKSYTGDEAVSILDIGAGPGEPSCTLAAAIPSAKITCTDASTAMTEKAQARSEKKGVKLEKIAVCSGDDLSMFEDGTFDYVTMNLTLMFVPDRVKCLQECARVLKPGGKVLSTCWKTMSFMAAIGATKDAFFPAFVGEPAPAAPPINPMALKDDNAQEEIGKTAGFDAAKTEVFEILLYAENEEVYKACSMIVMGPALTALEEKGKEGAKEEFKKMLITHGGIAPEEDGGFKLVGNQQMVVFQKA